LFYSLRRGKKKCKLESKVGEIIEHSCGESVESIESMQIADENSLKESIQLLNEKGLKIEKNRYRNRFKRINDLMNFALLRKSTGKN
jgi:hypothetical protein